jgi:hypothetical protein
MRVFSVAGLPAVAVLLGTTAAMAEVTPTDVWANWQASLEASGYTINGAAVADEGDTLTVTDAVFAMDAGTGTPIEIPFSPITMVSNGDGTVTVTYPGTVSVPLPDTGDGTSGTMNIDITGLQTVASGTPDAVTYTTEAPAAAVKLDLTGGPDTGTVAMDFTNVSAESTYTIDGDASNVDQSFAAANAAIAIDIASADGTAVKMTGSIADMSGEATGTFLGQAAMANIAEALGQGFVVDSSFAFGTTSLVVDITEATGPGKFTIDATDGSFGLYLGEEGLTYTVGMNGGNLAVSGAQIPLPEVRLGFGELLFDLGMPLVATGASSDFTYVTRLVDFTISDDVWGMVDPGGQFPRDPATIVVDATGTATLTTSLVDEAAMAALGDGAPGTIDSLNINALQVKFGGADVNGSGALTFDNTDMTTFAGIPAPTGKIDLTATGVNGLIDTLVNMGFVPADQASQAKMMMAMFAQPASDGSDSLATSVEFKDKGLFVNGQQLQ